MAPQTINQKMKVVCGREETFNDQLERLYNRASRQLTDHEFTEFTIAFYGVSQGVVTEQGIPRRNLQIVIQVVTDRLNKLLVQRLQKDHL